MKAPPVDTAGVTAVTPEKKNFAQEEAKRSGEGVTNDQRGKSSDDYVKAKGRAESLKGDSGEPKQRPTIGVLFSAPLAYVNPRTQQLHEMETLDFEHERDLLWHSFRKASRDISLRIEYATTETLRQMVTLGCRAIHYSGHGSREALSFEDGRGGCHPVRVELLRRLFSAGNGEDEDDASTIPGVVQSDSEEWSSTSSHSTRSIPGKKSASSSVQFVFVSACHSRQAGEAFVKAGVPHVVCVNIDSKLLDRAAQVFTSSFYLSLAVGKTVQAAFDIGQQTVAAAPDMPAALAEEEHRKFELLPKDGDHRKPIFPKSEVKQIDVWPPQTKSGSENEDMQLYPTHRGAVLPSVPEDFAGRNVEMFYLVSDLLQRRFVTISGAKGLGKSALAIAVSTYIADRKYPAFEDGIFFIRMERYRTIGLVLQALLDSIHNADARIASAKSGGKNAGRGKTASTTIPESEHDDGGSSSSIGKSITITTNSSSTTPLTQSIGKKSDGRKRLPPRRAETSSLAMPQTRRLTRHRHSHSFTSMRDSRMSSLRAASNPESDDGIEAKLRASAELMSLRQITEVHSKSHKAAFKNSGAQVSIH